MAKRFLIILSFLGLVFGYVAYEAYKLDNKLTEYSKQLPSNSAIKKLPEVVLPVFEDESNKFDFVKSAKEGNHLVVHFWATWCGPCEKEFPELVELTELMEGTKNVKFLFVVANDKVKSVKKFLSKFKKSDNYVVLVDNNFVHQNKFGTFKLPETYLFSPNMELIKKFVGPQLWTQGHIVELFKRLK